ncbi:MAG: glucose-1-phosphate cytidylyltransferase [Candidatus ainarchaeum sp.]|nr:glucose-1-phosphate cytidylyltransferase [Candidatus ainarchaeum sp.]
MKVVILAGGLGTRLSEETGVRPKPMVDIGGMPIIWHIMKSYSHYGCNDFVICLGYKGYMLKEYFANYFLHRSDVTISLRQNKVYVDSSKAEDWNITLVDTGVNTQTGGRLKRVGRHLDGTFMMTYGDGVSDVDISELAAFHKKHGKAATVTAVEPPGRFGALDLDGEKVRRFLEKPPGDGAWINGGYFVLEPEVLDYIEGDATSWEAGPVERLAAEGKMVARKHEGFWKPMDTLRDRNELDGLWASGKAPWKVWAD